MLVTFAEIARLDFAKGNGLLPAIVQHAGTGAVLMLAYMNREALGATLESQRVTFFSRSRQELWQKGSTSGNALRLEAIHADCDADALLVTAWPEGPVCHLGTRSCFGGEPLTRAEQLSFLGTLERVIESRIAEQPAGSYTAALYAQGRRRLAQKVGEEGVEVALAAVTEGDANLIGEAADLLYHLLVLLRSHDLRLTQLIAELEQRHAAKG